MFSFDFGSTKPFEEELQFAHDGVDNGALDDNKHLLIPEISYPNKISSNYWTIRNVDVGNTPLYLSSANCEENSALYENGTNLISQNDNSKEEELKEYEEKEEICRNTRSSSTPLALLSNISEIFGQHHDNLIKFVHEIVEEKYESYEDEEISLDSLKELEEKSCHK